MVLDSFTSFRMTVAVTLNEEKEFIFYLVLTILEIDYILSYITN